MNTWKQLFAPLLPGSARTDNGLLIEVWDSDPTPPQKSYLDDHLSTVVEISDGWNCYQPHNGGKVIWAELAMPQRQAAELPQRTTDDALSPDATRPARAKVLSIRLNQDEFEALNRHAEQLELPASTLVRGWILTRLRAYTDASPAATVDRIARDIEQLRRKLVS